MTDTKSLLAAVVEAEVAAADRVHALEMEISALQKQAKTWQSGSTAGSPVSAPKPQASGALSGPTHCQKVAARTKWINCFKCKQWGKHQANECQLKPCLCVLL